MVITDNNIEALSYKCNVKLNLLNTWSIRNSLTINFDKTELIVFSNREHLFDNSFVTIGPNSLQNVDNFKFHGITIYNSLTFRSSVKNVLSKVS